MATINCETCHKIENAVLAIITIKPKEDGVELVHRSLHESGPLGNCPLDNYGVDDEYPLLGDQMRADMFVFRYLQKMYMIKMDDQRIFTAHYARFTHLGYYADAEIFGEERNDLIKIFGELL